jgi:TRAP-type C4-dicarboxylate transport system substrate-binding protein
MKKMLLLSMVVVCSCFMFALAAPAPATAAPEITLRFAGQLPPEHNGTGYMNEIAKIVGERSGGRIEVKVYAANQLGDYGLVHQELIKGTIDMAMISAPGDIDPRMNFPYINYFASDYKQLEDAFKTGGWAYRKMDELNQAVGVKFLGFNVEGFIGLASTKPLTEPINPKVDKGVLCRVPNMSAYQLPAAAMGFRTMTIPYSDLYTSLQTGVVDAVDGLPPAAAYSILKDVTKYWYQLNYSIEVEPYFISMKTWEKLKPEDREMIAEVVAAIAERSIPLAKDEDEKYMKLMRDAGIQVFTYTAEELLPMRLAAVSTWPALANTMTKQFMEEFEKELGPKK